MLKRIAKILSALAVVIILTAGWLFFQIVQTGHLDTAGNADAIAVLGAAQYAGRPSPVFQARLDHAADLFKKGLAPLIITTGGIHPGEKFSEGEVGKKYLVQNGIPEEKVIAETFSLTTAQNMSRIGQIAKEKELTLIILVSDPFHMYRAKKVADHLGLNVSLSPTRTSPISKNKWNEIGFTVREMALTVLYALFKM